MNVRFSTVKIDLFFEITTCCAGFFPSFKYIEQKQQPAGVTMTTNTSRESVSGWEASSLARRMEQVARTVCGALLPGMFLGAMFVWATELLAHRSGLFEIPGVSLAGFSLGAIPGALLTDYLLARRGVRGILLFLALLLFLFSLFPEARVALVVCGLLSGGYFTALPAHLLGVRALFGASFALTAFLLPGYAFVALMLQIVLFPILFASAILWVKAHWIFRICLIAMLPVSSVLFAAGMQNRRPAVSPDEARSVATALPAVLMANSNSARILFLSERASLLPELWCGMPFVGCVESILSEADAPFPGGKADKFKPHSGPLARTVAAISGKFHLIYIDMFPADSKSIRRAFVEKLWELLEPEGGILVLPSVNRLLLPSEAKWVILPGSHGQRIAASRKAISADLELLDGRFCRLLEPFGEGNQIPAGIIVALYATASPPVLPAPEKDRAFVNPVSLELGYGLLLCLLLGYGGIRLCFGRYGRNSYGFALAETSFGFVLVLLAACNAMSCGELFTGVPASLIWGCIGLVFVILPLRDRAARVLALMAVLLPFVWLIPQNVCVEELFWIVAAAIAALTAGAIRGRIEKETAFPRSWCTIFSASGWLAGGMLYAVLHLLFREPLLPAILAAGIVRLAWPLKL